MAMFNPPRTGDFVKREIVEARGLTVTRAAEEMGVARTTLSAFLDGRTRLSEDLALRIEKAFGVRSATLLRMQRAWDTAPARRRRQ